MVNISKTDEGGIRLGGSSITLSRDEWEAVREYCRYLDRIRTIEENLDCLIVRFESIGGADNQRRADYIDKHKKELCEKLQGNVDNYIEEAITEGVDSGHYDIVDEIWCGIEDDVDCGAGIRNGTD